MNEKMKALNQYFIQCHSKDVETWIVLNISTLFIMRHAAEYLLTFAVFNEVFHLFVPENG